MSADKTAYDDFNEQHISRLANIPLEIFSEAAAGATSLALITSVVQLGLLIIMKLPPGLRLQGSSCPGTRLL